MPALITLQNESNLRQLAELVYDVRDDRDRARAEKALLTANPDIGTRDNLRAGAVVSVPSVPGLALRVTAVRDDPAAGVPDALGVAVEGYRRHLAARFEGATNDLAAQEELLKDREVVASLRKAGAVELAKQLSESLRARAERLGEDRKRQETMFRRIDEDLKTLSNERG